MLQYEEIRYIYRKFKPFRGSQYFNLKLFICFVVNITLGITFPTNNKRKVGFNFN